MEVNSINKGMREESKGLCWENPSSPVREMVVGEDRGILERTLNSYFVEPMLTLEGN